MLKHVLTLVLLGHAAPCAFAADDGFANAPGGTPQRAGALTGYAVRPPWKVAGIDYAIGPKLETVFKPASSAPGANANSKSVTIGSKNVTLDGYDFSGWTIACGAECDQLTISNSKFKAPSGGAQSPVIEASYGGYVTFTNNLVDGGGSGSSANPELDFGRGGTATYNLFVNIPNDAINITKDGSFVIRYNLFDTLNFGAGHTDCIQTFFSAVTSLDVQYNTVYAPNHAGAQEGNSFIRVGDERGNTVRGVNVAYNTLLFTTSKFPTAFDMSNGDGSGGKLLQPMVHDNYVDTTGIEYGIWPDNYNQITNPIYYDNVDMKAGKPLLASQYNNKTAGVPAAPPAAPTLTSVSGTTLSGTGPAGLSVNVLSDAGFVGAAKAGASGAWSVSGALPAGASTVWARATDAMGNASAASATKMVGSTPPPVAPPPATPPPVTPPPVNPKCGSVTLNGVTATTCLQ